MRPALSPRKTSPATETLTRELQEIPCLGKEGSSVRRRIKSCGAEKLEVSRSHRMKLPFFWKRHHHRNMEREDYAPEQEGSTNSSRDAEVPTEL